MSLIVKEKVTRSIRERVSNSKGEGNKINKRHIDGVLLYPNVSLIVKEKVTRSIRERVSNGEGEGNKINKRTCL